MDMSKLIEALMSGAQSTFSDEQPVERLGMLPLAKYKDGGVFPAVPGAVVDLYNSMNSGMTADPSQFNSASQEQRQAYDSQMIGDATNLAAALAGSNFAHPKVAGNLADQAQATYRTMAYPKERSIAPLPDDVWYMPAGAGRVEGPGRLSPERASRLNMMPDNDTTAMRGIQPPLSIVENANPRAMDFFKSLRKSESGSITSDKLYGDYVAWSQSKGIEPVGKGMFARMAADRGLQRSKIGGLERYIGIE